MARYDYRCSSHGAVEVDLPMGEATPTIVCPSCDQDAVRVFSPPLTTRIPRNVAGLLDRTERSRYEPDVVTSLPPGPAHRRTPVAPPNPAHRRLPRP